MLDHNLCPYYLRRSKQMLPVYFSKSPIKFRDWSHSYSDTDSLLSLKDFFFTYCLSIESSNFVS